MPYKCFIIQLAPPTFERVNIGVRVSDGEHHIERHVPQRTLDSLGTIFGYESSKKWPFVPSEDWQKADYWPEPKDFANDGYGMSVIKWHDSTPIASIEDQPEHGSLSLEQFAEMMYQQYCEWPREGIWGNDPQKATKTKGQKDRR